MESPVHRYSELMKRLHGCVGQVIGRNQSSCLVYLKVDRDFISFQLQPRLQLGVLQTANPRRGFEQCRPQSNFVTPHCVWTSICLTDVMVKKRKPSLAVNLIQIWLLHPKRLPKKCYWGGAR